MSVEFSLDAIAPPARAVALRETLANYRIPLDLSLSHHAGLSARFSSATIGSIEVESFSIAGASGSVGRAAVQRESAAPLVTVHLLESGQVSLHQDGRTATPSPGDLVFSSTRYAFTTVQRESCRQRTFSFREDELGATRQSIRSLLATSLTSNDPFVRVVSGQLTALGQGMSAQPAASWSSLEAATTALVRAIVDYARGDDRPVREQLALSLVERIFSYIRRNLDAPELSASSIAAAHGISSRYLYLLFSRRDLTLGSWIRRQRVERAAELLVAQPAMTIAEISYRCGFSDHSHFARTFRHERGVTPRQWRSDAASRAQIGDVRFADVQERDPANP